jgi:hypothetical protein
VAGRITHVRVTLEVPVSCESIISVVIVLSRSVDEILYGIFCHLSMIKYVEFEIKYQLPV